MDEKRHGNRDTRITPAISCIVKMPGGTTIDGVVEDLSDDGAGIAGNNVEGLFPGDTIEMILIVLADQKVVYQAEVRHIEPDANFFGVKFTSAPTPYNADDANAEKICCSHVQHTPFCAHCGKRLSDMVATGSVGR